MKPNATAEVTADGWDCELDSDCSFLSSGEERGWYVTSNPHGASVVSLHQVLKRRF